jgi:hypothetical protein
MTDTVFIDIDTVSWTAVTTTTGGFISNTSDEDILFVEATVAPAASEIRGITLRPKDRFPYTLAAGQELYARSARKDAVITNTPA